MSKPYGKRPRPRRPAPQTDEERSAALFSEAVKLFDKGDGRAVDWPMVAAMLFKAGWAAWDEAGRSPRALHVLRRMEAHVYDRAAGNEPEDGTDYTSGPLPRPPAGPQPDSPASSPAPGFGADGNSDKRTVPTRKPMAAP